MNDDAMDKIKAYLEEMHRIEECRDAVGEALQSHEEAAERGILMELWSQLGQSHHSYYVMFRAAEQFMKALKGMRDVKKLPYDLRLVVAEALAKCADMDVNGIKILMDKKAQFKIE
jgi:hypothetical protein